jgi:uncharacterized protein YggE
MRSLSAIALTIALSMPTMAAIAYPLQAQETTKIQAVKSERTLTVTGRGERSVKTTKARIQLGINVEAKTAIAVQTEVARKANSLVSRLQQLNVEQLQTNSIQLTPKYVYENNRQTQDGFVGQTSVSFIIAIPQAGATIDAAISAGANQVDQISFIATDAELNAAKQLALQDAVKDAQAQSNSVLSVLGLNAKSVESIVIGESAIAYPVPMPREALAAKADASTPILGSEQKVNATVTLKISY